MPRPSRKNDLLDAGIASVLTQGATQTTVEFVCSKVGVTKGAFFHHFQDKDDFVLEMLRHFGDRGATALLAVDLQDLLSAKNHLSTYLALLERIYGLDPWFRSGCLFSSWRGSTTTTHRYDANASWASIAGSSCRPRSSSELPQGLAAGPP